MLLKNQQISPKIEQKVASDWLRQMILLLIFFSTMLPAFSFSQAQLASGDIKNLTIIEKNDFSIALPANFSEVPVTVKNALLAVRNSDAQFPSFNIIVESGNYKFQGSKDTAEDKKIIDEYKLVGLLDVELKSSEVRQIEGYRHYIAILEYSYSGQKLRSAVSVVAAPQRHYILTYIDLIDKWAANSHYWDVLLKSFKISGTAPVAEDVRSYPYISLILIPILGFLIICCIYKLRRKS